MSQHLLKDTSRILMAQAAYDYLHREDNAIDPNHRKWLESFYSERIKALKETLAEVQRDFPAFYLRFETQLSLRAAIAQAKQDVKYASRHGSISAKPANFMKRKIDRELDRIPSRELEVPAVNPRDLIALVPLFKGLPLETLNEVAAQAKPVHFLTNDVIIGEGEHGHALYIVARGKVVVTQVATKGETKLVNDLEVGDFFGEVALLGDQIRTATVRAVESTTLLRLTRRDVLRIADAHPDVGQRLQKAQAARILHDTRVVS